MNMIHYLSAIFNSRTLLTAVKSAFIFSTRRSESNCFAIVFCKNVIHQGHLKSTLAEYNRSLQYSYYIWKLILTKNRTQTSQDLVLIWS